MEISILPFLFLTSRAFAGDLGGSGVCGGWSARAPRRAERTACALLRVHILRASTQSLCTRH